MLKSWQSVKCCHLVENFHFVRPVTNLRRNLDNPIRPVYLPLKRGAGVDFIYLSLAK